MKIFFPKTVLGGYPRGRILGGGTPQSFSSFSGVGGKKIWVPPPRCFFLAVFCLILLKPPIFSFSFEGDFDFSPFLIYLIFLEYRFPKKKKPSGGFLLNFGSVKKSFGNCWFQGKFSSLFTAFLA